MVKNMKTIFIIKDKYKNCYLWEDIPCNILESRFYKDNKICDDIGCDIIGINQDNTIDYIQCKNYSTTGEDNVISIYDLSGLYKLMLKSKMERAKLFVDCITNDILSSIIKLK